MVATYNFGSVYKDIQCGNIASHIIAKVGSKLRLDINMVSVTLNILICYDSQKKKIRKRRFVRCSLRLTRSYWVLYTTRPSPSSYHVLATPKKIASRAYHVPEVLTNTMTSTALLHSIMTSNV